jgi:N-glycosylase/DNA lyase
VSPAARIEPATVVAVPAGFRLDPTVRGHGWYDLPPFRWDGDGGLTFLHVRAGDEVLEVQVREAAGARALALEVASTRPLGEPALDEAVRVTREVLMLDLDLEPFHHLADADPAFLWVRPAGAGRLLRSPTVFEDLVKLICTTNCTWSATHRMVDALVDRLGLPSASGRRAFPTPARMAAEPESFYRDAVRAGYRAAALRELAVRAAREPAALERLRGVDWPSPVLRRALLALRGVGPYAGEHLMRLLGRYDFLAVDSWCAAKFARLRGRRRRPTPRAIERAYARFGRYRGLAMWLDLTHDWPCYGAPRPDPWPAG